MIYAGLLLLVFLLFFFYCYGHHRDLHSFPTRRSSDLSLLELNLRDGDMDLGQFHSQINLAQGEEIAVLQYASGNLFLVDEGRSEEHTSELQSQSNLVCRLLLEKKKPINSKIENFVHMY